MKYREFLSLTDDEVRFILEDIFQPVRVGNFRRDPHVNTITVEMTTDKWDNEETEITDEVRLTLPEPGDSGLDVDFFVSSEDELKWRQFLIAKGCHPLFKDNPYLMKV